MGKRHVIHPSTKEALKKRREQGDSFMTIAVEMGDPALKAALSAIERGEQSVGRETERRVRVGLGLPPRAESQAEVERKQLIALLNGAGLTVNDGLRIAARERGLLQ